MSSFPRRRIYAHLLSLAALTASTSAIAQSAAGPIVVLVDQARLMKVPDQVATLVIGNPLIADVTLQAGGTMVVTGKGYGVTNLIAMDRSGTVIEEHDVQVQAPTVRHVTVYRGIERETYSCTPVCERRVMIGDGPTYFNNILNQGGALSDRANTAAATAAVGIGGAGGGNAPGNNSSGSAPR